MTNVKNKQCPTCGEDLREHEEEMLQTQIFRSESNIKFWEFELKRWKKLQEEFYTSGER